MKKLIALTFLGLLSNAYAFECKEVVGKTFYSAGDSEFQYRYQFLKDGKAKLTTFIEEHDKGTIKEDFSGVYGTEKNNLTLNIKVDGVQHKIIFDCVDKVQYMAAGAFSSGLKVKKTIPENHGFSMIDLWPKGSSVIRQYFDK